VFPGRGGAKAMSVDGLRYHIVRIVADEIGAIIHPHLFRAFAARLVLEDSPGALEDVRLLLGDKTLVTVLAHYAALEPALAARRYDDVLRRTPAEAMRQATPQPRKHSR
jgi:integrase